MEYAQLLHEIVHVTSIGFRRGEGGKKAIKKGKKRNRFIYSEKYVP